MRRKVPNFFVFWIKNRKMPKERDFPLCLLGPHKTSFDLAAPFTIQYKYTSFTFKIIINYIYTLRPTSII